MNNELKAEELLKKFNMNPHEENGKYCECHYKYDGDGRAASGSSVFYVGPNEKTAFHKIDCDEYWCFNAGSSLDVWVIDSTGKLTITKFGVEDEATPLMYFPKGVIFGSKRTQAVEEGTFFTCITVPRFDYKGFELVKIADLIKICPEIENYER